MASETKYSWADLEEAMTKKMVEVLLSLSCICIVFLGQYYTDADWMAETRIANWTHVLTCF